MRHTERQAVPRSRRGGPRFAPGFDPMYNGCPEVYHVALDEVTGMETPSLGTVWPYATGK